MGKKIFTLKSEKQDSHVMTPKTPAKKEPYKFISLPSTPFLTLDSLSQHETAKTSKQVDPISSDPFCNGDLVDPFTISKRDETCEYTVSGDSSSKINEATSITVNKRTRDKTVDLIRNEKTAARDKSMPNQDSNNSTASKSTPESTAVGCNMLDDAQQSHFSGPLKAHESMCTCKEDVFVTKDYNLIYKAGEGDYYEVFVNKKTGDHSDEPIMMYKSRMLCLYDMNYTAVKKSKRKYVYIKNCIEREVEMLRKIQSLYVTKILDYWVKTYAYIELEYCNIGTLRDYMNEVYFLKKSRFSKIITNKLMFELSSGLTEIHKHNIVHLDVKPENVLLKSTRAMPVCKEKCMCSFPEDPDTFVFKVGDFNISRYENSEIDEDGDKRYMAPEVLQNVCTTASDVFSLGLIYVEIIREIILPNSGDNWMRLRNNDFRGIKIDRAGKLMLDRNYKRRLAAVDIVKIFRH